MHLGANPNSVGSWNNGYGSHKMPVLHYAVYHGNVGAVKLLLNAGAEIYQVGAYDNKHGTAYCFITSNNKDSVMKVLQDYEIQWRGNLPGI